MLRKMLIKGLWIFCLALTVISICGRGGYAGESSLKVAVLDVYPGKDAVRYNWLSNNNVKPMIAFLKELGIEADLIPFKGVRERILGPSSTYDMLFLPDGVDIVSQEDFDAMMEYAGNGKTVVIFGSAAKYYLEPNAENAKLSKDKKEAYEFIGVKHAGGGLADNITFLLSTPLTAGLPINKPLEDKEIYVEVCKQSWYLTRGKTIGICQGGYSDDFKAGKRSTVYFMVLSKHGQGHTLFCNLRGNIRKSELMQTIVKSIANKDTKAWLDQQ